MVVVTIEVCCVSSLSHYRIFFASLLFSSSSLSLSLSLSLVERSGKSCVVRGQLAFSKVKANLGLDEAMSCFTGAAPISTEVRGSF